jgi:hypothetical protein
MTMPSPQIAASDRGAEAAAVRSPLPGTPAGGQSFSALMEPLCVNITAKAPESKATDAVGNMSLLCQDNGGPSKSDENYEDADTFAQQTLTWQNEKDDNTEKDSNNDVLASLMASCTPRERSKAYFKNGQARLPAKELERMARTLHDSALAGKPKVSLGITVPELGEIRFDVQISGKIVFIHAFVDNERAASALALAVSSLRDRLEEHHLVLGRLDVTFLHLKKCNDSPNDKKCGDQRKDAHRRADKKSVLDEETGELLYDES